MLDSTLPQTSEPAATPAFREHFRRAYQNLRGAFTELLGAIGADPARPSDLSRRLGINHNLSWRVSKIVTARDEFVNVHHVPGGTALTSLLQAAGKAGAPDSALQRVRDALRAYDEMVSIHSGDRVSLEQLTATLSRDPGSIERLALGRRQAFLGVCGTWGVRAALQHTTMMVAPSRSDSSKLTCVLLGGMLNFRRLREDVRWPVYGRAVRDDSGAGVLLPRGEPIDPDAAPDGPPFVRDFCSPGLPGFEPLLVKKVTQFVLPPGPVGNTTAFTCVFGLIDRAVMPAHHTDETERARFGCGLTTPVERIQFDVLLSDELNWARTPQLELYSLLHGGITLDDGGKEHVRLPLLEDIQELGTGVSSMASQYLPRYTDLLHMACDRLGWNGDGFRGYRFTMDYPPIPTKVSMWWKLPAPGEST